MVSGIETFKNWFQDYPTRYVIIGGTACNLIFAEYGAPERATHDIDMVIVAEAFDREFYSRFVESKPAVTSTRTKPRNTSFIASRSPWMPHSHRRSSF